MAEDSGVQRHRLDVFALTLGLLALAGAGLALGARADAFEVDGLVVLATLWVVIGVVGVSRSVYRLVRGPRE
jgi:hypothetical protein